MTVVHKITGYDRQTEELALAFDLPRDRFDEIKTLVNLPPAYEELHGSFPLPANIAWELSWLLHLQMNVDHYDWFIEPFQAEPE